MPNWEQFGRMLEGFGAGYKGVEAPWQKEQMRREEMDMRRQQLGISQGSLDVQRGSLDIQRQEAARRAKEGAADTSLKNQQAFKAYWDNLKSAQEALQSIEDPTQREGLARKFAPMFRSGYHAVEPDADNKGLIDDDTVAGILLTPGSEEDVSIAFRHLLAPEQKRAGRSVKDPAKRRDFLREMALDNARAFLPSLTAKVREVIPPGSTELVDPRTVEAKVPFTNKEWEVYRFLVGNEDPKRVESFYNKLGLLAPSQIAEKQNKPPTKPFLTEGLGNFLSASPTFQKLKIKPEDLVNLDPEIRNQIEGEARQLKQDFELKKIERQGAAQATAQAGAQLEFEQNRPYADWPGREKGQTYRNIMTGEEAPGSLTMGAIRRDSNLKPLTEKREQSFRDARTVRVAILPQWRAVVDGLADQPGENWVKALDAKAKELLGQESISVALGALQATLLTIARGVNAGVAAQLSDRDLNTVINAVVSLKDGKASGTQRLDILERLFTTLEGVALGRMNSIDANKSLATMAKETKTVDITGPPRRVR